MRKADLSDLFTEVVLSKQLATITLIKLGLNADVTFDLREHIKKTKSNTMLRYHQLSLKKNINA